MNFTISSYKLFTELQYLHHVINNNNILPILSNLLFEFQEQKLIITGSDLETTISVEIKNINYYGNNIKLAIPAKLITNILKNLKDQIITLIIKDNEKNLEIVSQQGKYIFNIQDGNNFPETLKLNNTKQIILSNHLLLKIINYTLFVTSNDDLRPVMTGVFFNFKSDGSTFVATDSQKLVKYFIKTIKSEEGIHFIVPKKSLNIIKNILASIKDRKNVILEYNQNNIIFYFDNKKIIARLINGKYPDYESIIPNNYENIILINRVLLLNSIKRLSLFANKTTQAISLYINNNQIKISSEDNDCANRAYESISCVYNSLSSIKIAFNYKIFIEMLAHLDIEEIILEILKPNMPVILKPSSNSSYDELIMLIMPILFD